jgi:hypothetical protein
MARRSAGHPGERRTHRQNCARRRPSAAHTQRRQPALASFILRLVQADRIRRAVNSEYGDGVDGSSQMIVSTTPSWHIDAVAGAVHPITVFLLEARKRDRAMLSRAGATVWPKVSKFLGVVLVSVGSILCVIGWVIAFGKFGHLYDNPALVDHHWANLVDIGSSVVVLTIITVSYVSLYLVRRANAATPITYLVTCTVLVPIISSFLNSYAKADETDRHLMLTSGAVIAAIVLISAIAGFLFSITRREHRTS